LLSAEGPALLDEAIPPFIEPGRQLLGEAGKKFL